MAAHEVIVGRRVALLDAFDQLSVVLERRIVRRGGAHHCPCCGHSIRRGAISDVAPNRATRTFFSTPLSLRTLGSSHPGPRSGVGRCALEECPHASAYEPY